jgi:hypothetical protein
MRIRIRRAKIEQSLRDQFELYGKEVVAFALGLGTTTSGGLGAAHVNPTVAMRVVHQKQKEAAEWLREQRDRDERRDAVRFWGMLFLTFVAAVAACIAAWPIIKNW